MKGLAVEIDFLCLPPQVNEKFESYCAQFSVDGTEHSYSALVSFLVEARRSGVKVEPSHVDIALPVPEWKADTVQNIGDAVDAVQQTLDYALEQLGANI